MMILSQLIRQLSMLVNSECYAAIGEVYLKEEMKILRQLRAAQSTNDLLKIQGKAIMLERVKDLPEDMISKYKAEGK